MCLFDLEVGAVYVAVCSIVKDDPLASEVISPRAGS